MVTPTDPHPLEILWRLLDARDRTLARLHHATQRQLADKEEQIYSKELEIDEKEELIQKQHRELETLRRSLEYRVGYILLNPWKIVRLLVKSGLGKKHAGN
ncbi:MAG: hypothetical protein AB1898_06205 [Acidobacteriota bacterium]